jgi:hypothetical protein
MYLLLIIVAAVGLYNAPAFFGTAILLVVGVLLAFKFFTNPLFAMGGLVIVIAGFSIAGAVAGYNRGWFDITQPTAQLVANPPQNKPEPATSTQKTAAAKKSVIRKVAAKRAVPKVSDNHGQFDEKTTRLLEELRNSNFE